MLGSLIKKLMGDPRERTYKKYQWLVDEVNALEPQLEALSDADLRAKTDAFKARLEAGESVEDLMAEAFATVREAAKRTIGLRPYDVQIIGGAVLHEGKVAEMKTGEGKTLVASLPLYLNALTGKGVHLVTPNDYLSKVGVQQMGLIYHFLGLSSGVIQNMGKNPQMASFLFDPEFQADDDRYQNLRPSPRRAVYAADITYGTNNEFGFDYLRDNMVWDLSERVQRPLNYAIVDEVDNILIDEARTPLIISGPAEEATESYVRFAEIVRGFRRDVDYLLDEKMRNVTPTDEGVEKVERLLGIGNLYSAAHYELTPYFENALKAQVLYQNDKEYIVKDGEVIIVDEFTGRLMFGRRFSEGLHQAIEAKEGVAVQRESMTLATVTFQNFFRMYEKLAGMTGTALTEAEELDKIYKLEVLGIPTHRPIVRADGSDLIYPVESAKWKAVVEEIAERHGTGQPILVGTVSVENSERLSKLLTRRGVPHEVLNAKNHEREAEIIAQAGKLGAVTIATNMAGRGVDILLGGNAEGMARAELRRRGVDLTEVPSLEWDAVLQNLRAGVEPEGEVPEWADVLRKHWQTCRAEREQIVALSGLFVLGTERHEARRIDNQLRGRSGRQGDPGESRFYVALEDELMLRFGGERVKNLMARMGVAEDEVIESSLVTRQIESAQVKVEGFNFDIRKHLLEYDEVINEQRRVIYDQRTEILRRDDLREVAWPMIEQEVEALIASHTALPDRDDWDLVGLAQTLRGFFPLPEDEDPTTWKDWSLDALTGHLLSLAEEAYEAKETRLGPVLMGQLERMVMLRVIDQWWIRHLTAIDELRTGIGLRAAGQQDPLVTFKREGYRMFQTLMDNITAEIARGVFLAEPVTQQTAPAATRPPQAPERRAPSGSGRPRLAEMGRLAAPVMADLGRGSSRVGRNDPCPCGSGKKYKQCHMKEDMATGVRG
ncbi:MAG: preprotein translocase subunit SecA [Ardenticatenia bacterium]|nr:preprotein translocase subunit SecA [Ardenticatenia bacterium]